MRALICCVALSYLALGCSAETTTAGPTEVVDSAGIRIVTSRVPSGAAFNWTLSASPSLSIGGNDEDESQLLYRVMSARTLPDGSILASNSGTQEVRVYSTEGELQRSFARPGQGPGEFAEYSSMRILDLSADSVWLNDGGNVRVVSFGLDGSRGGELRATQIPGYGRTNLVGRFGTGEWVGLLPVGTGTLNGEVGDLIHMDMAYLVFNADIISADAVVQVAGRPRLVSSLGGGVIHFPSIPFTSSPVHAVSSSHLSVVSGVEPEVRRYRPDGTLIEIFRWHPPRIAVASIWDRYVSESLEGISEDRRPSYRRLYANRDLPVPDTVPVASGLLIDETGNTWIERYRLPWDSARRWDILSPTGEWLGTLDTPDGVRVLEIGETHLLGRHVDELGVERLVSYGLTR